MCIVVFGVVGVVVDVLLSVDSDEPLVVECWPPFVVALVLTRVGVESPLTVVVEVLECPVDDLVVIVVDSARWLVVDVSLWYVGEVVVDLVVGLLSTVLVEVTKGVFVREPVDDVVNRPLVDDVDVPVDELAIVTFGGAADVPPDATFVTVAEVPPGLLVEEPLWSTVVVKICVGLEVSLTLLVETTAVILLECKEDTVGALVKSVFAVVVEVWLDKPPKLLLSVLAEEPLVAGAIVVSCWLVVDDDSEIVLASVEEWLTVVLSEDVVLGEVIADVVPAAAVCDVIELCVTPWLAVDDVFGTGVLTSVVCSLLVGCVVWLALPEITVLGVLLADVVLTVVVGVSVVVFVWLMLVDRVLVADVHIISCTSITPENIKKHFELAYESLHVCWSTQSRLAILLSSLIARPWVRLQTLWRFRLKDLSIDEMVGSWCFGCL